MVFSSSTFLFVFLPVVLLLYYLLSRRLKNLFLLFASLLFYSWGEIFYVLIMLASITANYLFGLGLGKQATGSGKKVVLSVGILFNLGLLAYYKYANFIVENINKLISLTGTDTIDWTPVHLPLGISFFTFQAMSYLVDVYREESHPQRNIINVALYISLFPQLIAGPIVRYHDIARQITGRTHSLALVNSGIQRFVYGLAKKVLIANPLGLVADQVFAISGGDLTTGVAWLGIVCYTLQIYFDFSGYSDMAIGLGRMLGFRFLENFNYPYIASSVREFWRRWHISLSSWFRDYLYIPLGGNRKGPFRTGTNLLIVFTLCGFWHGASWTFLTWGLFHGGFLVLERTRFGRQIEALPRYLQHVYLLLIVMVGWVFFRTDSMDEALHYLSALAGLADGSGDTHFLARYLDVKVGALIILGVFLATPLAAAINRWTLESIRSSSGKHLTQTAAGYAGVNLTVMAALLWLCLMSIAANAYNPFIYFRF